MSETWLPVVGYEGFYEVSDRGNVRSVTRKINGGRWGYETRKGQPMKTRSRGGGYLSVTLSKEGDVRAHSVHSLVLTAFVGPRPLGFDCCHGNGIRDDNRLENLRWDTKSANMQDKIRHGSNHQLNKTHCKRGHLYDEANTLRSSLRDGRWCRACHRDRQREAKRRRTGYYDRHPRAVCCHLRKSWLNWYRARRVSKTLRSSTP